MTGSLGGVASVMVCMTHPGRGEAGGVRVEEVGAGARHTLSALSTSQIARHQ